MKSSCVTYVKLQCKLSGNMTCVQTKSMTKPLYDYTTKSHSNCYCLISDNKYNGRTIIQYLWLDNIIKLKMNTNEQPIIVNSCFKKYYFN